MADWSIETVEARLVEAAVVTHHLSLIRVPTRLPPPSHAPISRMAEALNWLRWLEAEDAKLIWARSNRMPWKSICSWFGIGRATANRRWQYGLSVIAWRLDGRAVPVKRSRQFMIERARFMSSIL